LSVLNGCAEIEIAEEIPWRHAPSTFTRQDAVPKEADLLPFLVMNNNYQEPTNPGTYDPLDKSPGLEYAALTGQIIGAAIRVHRELGPGFVESVYANALEIELRLAGIPFVREQLIRVVFREQEVGRHRPDFVVASRIITELKAVKAIDDTHFVVVRSYLRAAGLEHGLLLNFAKLTLEARRVAAHR
jgi:GxxExxY protein